MKRINKDTDVGRSVDDNWGKTKDGEAWRLVLLLAVVISLFSGCVTRSKVIGYIADHSEIKDSILAANPCVFKVDSSVAAKVDTSGLIQFLQSKGGINYTDSKGYSPLSEPIGKVSPYIIDSDQNSDNSKGIHTNIFNPTRATIAQVRKIDTAAIIAGLSKYYVPRIDFEQDERTLNSFKNLIADKCEVIAGLNANLSDAGNTIDKLQKKADKYMIWIVVSNIFWFILCVLLFIELFRKEIKLPL